MPWWFPGAGFKKEAQSEWVPHVDTALHAPYETVRRQMARNSLSCLSDIDVLTGDGRLRGQPSPL
jgi:hypothetical protein